MFFVIPPVHKNIIDVEIPTTKKDIIKRCFKAPRDAVEELLNFRGDLHIFEGGRIVPGPPSAATGRWALEDGLGTKQCSQ